jgi:hypothetical protein
LIARISHTAPSRRVLNGWVNSDTVSPVYVRPSHWRALEPDLLADHGRSKMFGTNFWPPTLVEERHIPRLTTRDNLVVDSGSGTEPSPKALDEDQKEGWATRL